MTTKIIKKDDSSYIMETVMPDSWAPDSTITVSIYDPTSGTAIVDGAAIDSRLSNTLDLSADAGEFEVFLADDTTVFKDGDRVALGSTTQGWQRFIVNNYNTATEGLGVVRSIGEDLVAGSQVEQLNIKYTVDASVEGFDQLNRVKVVWSPGGDEMPLTELWEIYSELSNVQGLESEFRVAYSEYYKLISSEEFESYEDRARQSLKLYFESRLRNFDKIVDSDLIREPMLTEIALMLGISKMSEEEYLRLRSKRDEDLAQLNNLSIWTDTDQDNIRDDSEDQPAQDFLLKRGY